MLRLSGLAAFKAIFLRTSQTRGARNSSPSAPLPIELQASGFCRDLFRIAPIANDARRRDHMKTTINGPTRRLHMARIYAITLLASKASAMYRRAPVVALALAALLGPAACTGSPETLALRPDFEVKVMGSIDSVSIRDSLPGMTDSEFGHLIMMG